MNDMIEWLRKQSVPRDGGEAEEAYCSRMRGAADEMQRLKIEVYRQRAIIERLSRAVWYDCTVSGRTEKEATAVVAEIIEGTEP
jgi:hypothetical protein